MRLMGFIRVVLLPLALWLAPAVLWAETQSPAPQPAQSISRDVPGAAPEFRPDAVKPAETSRALGSSLFREKLAEYFRILEPDQGGIIWLAFAVFVALAFDFSGLVSRRNVDILLLLAPSLLFINLTRFSVVREPVKLSLARFVFLGIFLMLVVYLVRALAGALRAERTGWQPNIPLPALRVLLVTLVMSNTLLVMVRMPNDCGIYTNIGAARMIETGRFPYGDPALKGGAAATYGPVLYLAHIPFQLALSATKVHAQTSDPAQGPNYLHPPLLATRLTLLTFHILGLWALITIGRKLGSPAAGWGLACLYAASPYVQGLGGAEFSINGVTYISHIAPAAVLLLAFAALDQPVRAGALLGVAAGVLFWPAFLVPLWFGYYFWRRIGWKQFIAAFLMVCALIVVVVWWRTASTESETVLQVVHRSTVGHQEGKEAYGSSTFGFWGTHPSAAAFWQQPLVTGWPLLKPAFLLFAVFLVVTFFLARGRTVAQFALLTAAVAIATQLWKSHAGGTYVEWYLPFLLIGLFTPGASRQPDSV